MPRPATCLTVRNRKGTSARRRGSCEGRGMSDADVDADEDATRVGWRKRDRPASWQPGAGQPACPHGSVTEGETGPSVVLTGDVQYRSEPTMPDATGKSSDRLLISTCHYPDGPASSLQGWHAASACKFLSGTLGRPRNLEQKLIGMLGRDHLAPAASNGFCLLDAPTHHTVSQ